MTAKSLLFTGDVPYEVPPECRPGRAEATVTIHQYGRTYKMVLRDKVVVEDPYLVLVKATAFAIRESEPYMGRSPDRSVRDVIIKSNVII